jgi:SSS family solute:Na+ symporter
MFVFGISLSMLALAASTLPGVSDASDAVWFISADVGGPFVVTLAGLCVVAGTMGNVGANLQALGAQTANDVVAVARGQRIDSPRVGQVSVALLCVLSAVFAIATAQTVNGLITLALVSYQGIAQLAPTLFLGIFWRRGNAVGATAAMVGGFATAALLQWKYPISIPALEGLTSGCVALVVNVALYVGFAYAIRPSDAERERVDRLFDALGEEQTTETATGQAGRV